MAKSRESADQLALLIKEIRNDIIFGAYAPGTWLKLTDLQAHHGASAFHIRRALAELANLKLVDHAANAGFRVATPDDSTRVETRFVRTVLERSAAPLIAARATSEDVAELARLAEAFDQSIMAEGRREQALANHNFHSKLYATAGNQVLCDMIDELRNRSQHSTTGRWRSVDGLRASSLDHFSIVKAIEMRDPIELDRIIVRHIESF